MKSLDARVARAVKHFWTTRSRQDRSQGSNVGKRDYGNRTAATGGKQLDGFNKLIVDLLMDSGIPEDSIYCEGRSNITIPGFFRPTKQWDVLVVANGQLLACIECKSLCGPSFGNNYNNRIEEALGSSTDLWTAYREQVFDASPRPFAGYLLLLEDAEKSTSPVRVTEKHFAVLDDYQGASYAERCQQSVLRLVRERCYDAACLILSSRKTGVRGKYREPAKQLTFETFAKRMCNRVAADFRSI